MNSHSPLMTPLTTPPAEPASSPVVTAYFAPFTAGMFPSIVTVGGPAIVSADFPVFG